jgi:DNA-binding XRE family transcriptional regulator
MTILRLTLHTASQRNGEPKSVKAVRRAARVTVAEAARIAQVSPTTWRLFEANIYAVTDSSRERCQPAFERLRALANAHEAA